MDLKSVKNITLDFYNTKMVSVNAKMADKQSRYILVTCTDQGNLVVLNKDNHSAFIRYRKADELGVFNQCIITDEGEILIELTEQMLAAPGNCIADLLVIDSENLTVEPDISVDGDVIPIPKSAILSTMLFRITVIETPFDNSEIESSYEFNALNDLMEKALADYTFVITESKKNTDDASASEEKAKNYSALSQSYAVGTDNVVRTNDSTDNAKHYYELTLKLAQGFNVDYLLDTIDTLTNRITQLENELASYNLLGWAKNDDAT